MDTRCSRVGWLAHRTLAAATSAEQIPERSTNDGTQKQFALNEDGDVVMAPKLPARSLKTTEYINFPSSPDDINETQPVLLNAKEHVVGYLSRILNARVYDVSIETELQHAKNMSSVRIQSRW